MNAYLFHICFIFFSIFYFYLLILFIVFRQEPLTIDLRTIEGHTILQIRQEGFKEATVITQMALPEQVGINRATLIAQVILIYRTTQALLEIIEDMKRRVEANIKKIVLTQGKAFVLHRHILPRTLCQVLPMIQVDQMTT